VKSLELSKGQLEAVRPTVVDFSVWICALVETANAKQSAPNNNTSTVFAQLPDFISSSLIESTE
jgi:hypothetical protein